MTKKGPITIILIFQFPQDTVTPQLLHFLLDHSHVLEDLSVEAGAAFVNESFLYDVLRHNQLRQLERLRLAVSPSIGLTARLARRVIEEVTSLRQLSLSKWNVQARELRALNDYVKKNNYDLTLV